MATASELLWLAVLGLQAGGARPQAPPRPPPYPWEVVPEDALHGYLSEGNFREPIGVFWERTAGELYVADSKNARIGIFDDEFTPVFSFGGAAVLLEPRTVLADGDGTIFVLDVARTELLRFNYRGEAEEPLRFLRPASSGEPAPIGIAALARTADGGWLVADRDENRVWRFDADLAPAGELPPPIGRSHFDLVADVAVADDGLIAVCDQRGVPVVHVYDASGKLLAAFGEHDIGLDNFTSPIAVAFDESGYLYVVDLLRHDVKVFTPDGRFVSRFGGWFSPETRGRAPGELLYPSDVAIAPGGPIFVAERFGQRVQVFVRRERTAGAGPSPSR